MKIASYAFLYLFLFTAINEAATSQVVPDEIRFVRQGVQRMIFDEEQSILLAKLEPKTVVGLSTMYPISHHSNEKAKISVSNAQLVIQSEQKTRTGIWFGGFNPFATYSLDLASCTGEGEIGFEFSDANQQERFIITAAFNDTLLTGVQLKVTKNAEVIAEESVAVNLTGQESSKGKIILQMLGSGLVLYSHNQGLPKVIGRSDFNTYLDLRSKHYIHSFQSSLYLHLVKGQVAINQAEIAITTGVGLADIRAITYENGDPFLDQGRLWYTMSIRGRALPHHIQGVFSMNPTVFDVRLEGIILFDRDDGLLRNEIASHIFYDRNHDLWRGITIGFSSFANPDEEKKQLLAVESKLDPRFGFSVMHASPFGVIGDIEDPHLLFDSEVEKWRMITCVNQGGYKATMLESDYWNKGYEKISGPVDHNSTGTSLQKIGDKLYAFSGSRERKIFIYTYPDLAEAGTLQMDLPPWNETSGTRVWPNVIQLPEGYPFKYVALMMDRFDYPGMPEPNWTYGAIYLYHGYD